ncbi:MAG: DM13 domain-containing protein [Colwellia sp.]|nr:DM13 domain-containing protein [Colwellia sp.]
MFNRFFATYITVLLLSACGGGSSDSKVIPPVELPPEPTIYTGIFLDSAVENLSFTTVSGSGFTNDKGEFSYQLNESVIFSIGALEFPQVAADVFITPLSIFATQDINEIAVVNMLRLLQSLDIDGNANNGIQISSAAHDLAKELMVNFTDIDFDSKVANLVEMSGALNQQLISAADAVYHFQQTLNELNISSCEKTHSKVGYNGFFTTLAHNVSGKATIIDDCTIRITQFSYDGGGPDVYFYAAKNHEYSSADAFSISQKINGQSYTDAEFILKLPTNKTLDDLTGLSVWCVDFNVDFGNMEFTQ